MNPYILIQLPPYPGLNLEIIGHASETGDSLYNQQLSSDRASQVHSYISSFTSIDAGRLSQKVKNNLEPIIYSDSDLMLNQRVEFRVFD